LDADIAGGLTEEVVDSSHVPDHCRTAAAGCLHQDDRQALLIAGWVAHEGGDQYSCASVQGGQ
jgi:hypothetical protein